MTVKPHETDRLQSDTIIQPNRNRTQRVTLNFEAMSLSIVIVNSNIVILDMHSCSASQIYEYECKIHMY